MHNSDPPNLANPNPLNLANTPPQMPPPSTTLTSQTSTMLLVQVSWLINPKIRLRERNCREKKSRSDYSFTSLMVDSIMFGNAERERERERERFIIISVKWFWEQKMERKHPWAFFWNFFCIVTFYNKFLKIAL